MVEHVVNTPQSTENDTVHQNAPLQKNAHKTKAVSQAAFLESFAKHGIIQRACDDANVNRSTVTRWKEHEDQFLIRYNIAKEQACDVVREEIRKRAQDGWDEAVYQLGKHAGTVHKYSDTLLIFRAKALMEEYRDKHQVQVSGSLTIKTEWGGGALMEESEVQHGSIS